MPRVNPIQQTFNAGELSPLLAARTRMDRFAAGLDTCLNLIPLVEGAVMRRPGTRYVAAVKDSSAKTRLLGFQFSTSQAYIIEMGNTYFKFYRTQGQIAVADTAAAISNGTFTSNITGWTDRSTGGAGNAISHDSGNGRLTLGTNGTAANDIGWAEQVVTNSGTAQVVLKFQVIGAPSDKIELRIGTSSVGSQLVADVEFQVGYHCYAFTPTAANFYVQFRNLGGNADKDVQIDNVSLIDDAGVEIDTPYATADLFEINGPQSADVLYLFHEDYPAYKLSRLGNESWSLIEVPWQDGPYLSENKTTTTMTAGAATGLGVTVTASSTVGVNGGDGFQTTDVGRLIRITDGSSLNWGWGVIVSYTSTTAVKVDIRRTFVVTTAETTWRLGSWSGTTGYPRAAGFFEQRLVAGGSTDNPQSFWISQSAADFENFAPDSDPTAGTWDGTIEDDDSLNWTIGSDEVNTIQFLLGGRTLVIGTYGGEWIASSDGPVMTPTDISVARNTKYGSKLKQPLLIGNQLLFLQRAGRKIIELGFSFEDDSYRGFDVTRLARHVTYGGIEEMAYAQEPDPIVWAVRSDGVLIGLIYNRDEKIIGWFRCILGGSFGSGDSVVESVAVIPGTNGAGQVQDSISRDEVWVVVKRTIDGSTVRYVEFLERAYETGHDQDDAYYADSIITYDGDSATTITGLTHLEGESVKIWADGAVQATKTVASGQITLDDAASTVQIGLSYTHRGKTLKLDYGAAAGTAVGKKKSIHAITFVLLNSHTLSAGPATDDLTDYDFRVVSDPMDAGAPLFTGESSVDFDGDWEDDSRIVFESSDPAPFMLLAIAPEMKTNEMA